MSDQNTSEQHYNLFTGLIEFISAYFPCVQFSKIEFKKTSPFAAALINIIFEFSSPLLLKDDKGNQLNTEMELY